MEALPTTAVTMSAARPPQGGPGALSGPPAGRQATESTGFDALVGAALAVPGALAPEAGNPLAALRARVPGGGETLPPDGQVVAAQQPGLPALRSLAAIGAPAANASSGGPAGARPNPGPAVGQMPLLLQTAALAGSPSAAPVLTIPSLSNRAAAEPGAERRLAADGLVAAPAPEPSVASLVRTPGLEPAGSVVARALPLPVDQPAVFGERLSHHVSVMLTQHAQTARIAVTPPDLGPVDVRVVVVGDEASVQLISPHAATRDALEEALPRLRAMFADSGLVLDQAGVFSETPKQRHHGYADSESGTSRADGEPVTTALEGRVHVSVGLIDAFV